MRLFYHNKRQLHFIVYLKLYQLSILRGKQFQNMFTATFVIQQAASLAPLLSET